MKRFMLLIAAATFAWFTGCREVPVDSPIVDPSFSGTLEVDQAIALPNIEGFEETARLAGTVSWKMERLADAADGSKMYKVGLAFNLGIQPTEEGLAKRYPWVADGSASGMVHTGGGSGIANSYEIKGIHGTYKLDLRFEVREREASAEVFLARAAVRDEN